MKVSDEILSLTPYAPGKPIEETRREYGLDKVYKLASNENLLGVSPRVKKALHDFIDEIHRYPDGSAYALRQSASKFYGVSTNKIGFGNGSDELISLLIRGFCEPSEKILISKGSFLLYKIFSQGSRVGATQVDLTSEYKIDFKEIMNVWDENHRLIFLPNPNNPTGTYLSSLELKGFLDFFKEKDVLIVLDEAYFEFVTANDYPNGVQLQSQYPNLVVLRTTSKDFGLAGLRLGVMFAEPEIVSVVERIRTPFNVNAFAQVAGIAAFSDPEFVIEARKLNSEGLKYFEKELTRLGVRYWPSQGNFIFFDSERDSDLVYQELLKRGVILRPLKPYGFQTQLRMSVGLQEENLAAITALEEVLKICPKVKS